MHISIKYPAPDGIKNIRKVMQKLIIVNDWYDIVVQEIILKTNRCFALCVFNVVSSYVYL